MVPPARLELTTCGLGIRRSIHLSYGGSIEEMLYPKKITILSIKGKQLLGGCIPHLVFSFLLSDSWFKRTKKRKEISFEKSSEI